MKTTCRRCGRASPDKKVDANICNPLLKAEVKGVFGCRTVNTAMEFANQNLIESWRWRWFCFRTGDWPKLVGEAPFPFPARKTPTDQREVC